MDSLHGKGNASALEDAINENLRSGRWRVGHRLPTERALSEAFGISRTTVRRVLTIYKERRLISQVVGSGTYVGADVSHLLPDVAASRARQFAPSPAELMEARLALEPAIVQLVIRSGTSADFDRMDLCCENAEAAPTLGDFERWDGLLHEAIAEAAHNSLILNVFRSINSARNQEEWGILKKRSVTPQRRLAYQIEHRNLVRALRTRDLDAAREATRIHLEHVGRSLFGY